MIIRKVRVCPEDTSMAATAFEDVTEIQLEGNFGEFTMYAHGDTLEIKTNHGYGFIVTPLSEDAIRIEQGSPNY